MHFILPHGIKSFTTKLMCIFCDIVSGKAPSHKIWEDEEHLAFLSIFPNTPGVGVLIPKKHHQSDFAHLPQEVLTSLIKKAQVVSQKIVNAFESVGRCALVFEGFGVDHIHAKLFPMHGTKGEWSQRSLVKPTEFFETYPGYISSHDSLRADDKELDLIAEKIRKG